jgi:O-antigen ligase
MILFLVIPSLLLLSLLTLIRQSSALVLLAVLLPAYLIRFSFFRLPTNFLEAAIITVFFFSFLQPVIRSQWLTAWRIVPLTLRLLVALFIISAAISTIVSPHHLVSLGILKSWIIIPLLFGWQILAAQLYPFSSGGAAKQAVGPDTQATILPSQSPSSVYALSIIQSLILSGDTVALLGLLQFNHQTRIQSVYDVPNSLALFLVPLFIICIWLSFARYRRLFYIPSALIMAAAVIATQSASGLAAALIVLVVGLLIFPPINSSAAIIRWTASRRWLAVFLLIFISVGYLLFTGRISYLTLPLLKPDSHNSLSIRRQLWSISLDLIKDHPVLGVGLGTFEPAYQAKLHQRFFIFANCPSSNKQCPSPIPEFVYRDPHNWPLSLWLNTGLLGLISFILINVYVLIHVRRSLLPLTVQNTQSSSASVADEQTSNTYLIQALTLALLSILIFGLADTIYWKNDLSVLYWLILAGLFAQTHALPQASLQQT